MSGSGGPMRRERQRSRPATPFKTEVLESFETHHTTLKAAHAARKEAVQLRSVVTDNSLVAAVDIRDTLGVKQPQDRWQGCTNLRTLRQLLLFVDDRGFERSPHQVPSYALTLSTL